MYDALHELLYQRCRPSVISAFDSLEDGGKYIMLDSLQGTLDQVILQHNTGLHDSLVPPGYVAERYPNSHLHPVMEVMRARAEMEARERGGAPCRVTHPPDSLLHALDVHLSLWGTKRGREEVLRHALRISLVNMQEARAGGERPRRKGGRHARLRLRESGGVIHQSNSCVTKPNPSENRSGWGGNGEELCDITVSDLVIFTPMLGCKLVGTIVVPPCHLAGVMTAIEDSTGAFIELALYNQLGTLTLAGARGMFPLGSQVEIREPFLKIFASGSIGVRVDSPEDIRVTPPPPDTPRGESVLDIPAAARHIRSLREEGGPPGPRSAVEFGERLLRGEEAVVVGPTVGPDAGGSGGGSEAPKGFFPGCGVWGFAQEAAAHLAARSVGWMEVYLEEEGQPQCDVTLFASLGDALAAALLSRHWCWGRVEGKGGGGGGGGGGCGGDGDTPPPPHPRAAAEAALLSAARQLQAVLRRRDGGVGVAPSPSSSSPPSSLMEEGEEVKQNQQQHHRIHDTPWHSHFLRALRDGGGGGGGGGGDDDEVPLHLSGASAAFFHHHMVAELCASGLYSSQGGEAEGGRPVLRPPWEKLKPAGGPAEECLSACAELFSEMSHSYAASGVPEQAVWCAAISLHAGAIAPNTPLLQTLTESLAAGPLPHPPPGAPEPQAGPGVPVGSVQFAHPCLRVCVDSRGGYGVFHGGEGGEVLPGVAILHDASLTHGAAGGVGGAGCSSVVNLVRRAGGGCGVDECGSLSRAVNALGFRAARDTYTAVAVQWLHAFPAHLGGGVRGMVDGMPLAEMCRPALPRLIGGAPALHPTAACVSLPPAGALSLVLTENAFAHPAQSVSLLFPLVSLMNHAAQPKARVLVADDGRTATVVVCETIAPGEEVTIQYSTGGDDDLRRGWGVSEDS